MKPRTVAQLRAVFERERALFAETYPAVRNAELSIDWRLCMGLDPGCSKRDYAYAMRDGRSGTVVLSHRARTLPVANLRGILRHELGHLADFASPHWRKPGAEQRADDLAERATGQKIRYDARDVQTTGPGTYPRPRHLHR